MGASVAGAVVCEVGGSVVCGSGVGELAGNEQAVVKTMVTSKLTIVLIFLLSIHYYLSVLVSFIRSASMA
jgi:hypothetical protein